MLLSKPEGGNTQIKRCNNFRSKLKGADLFPNLKTIVFLDVCMRVSSKTLYK